MTSHHRPRSDIDPSRSKSRRSIDTPTTTSSFTQTRQPRPAIMDPESMRLPDRFRNDDDDNDGDDGTGVGNEDITAVFAQQSMYGMLAVTQSHAVFPSQFQQDSGSESEGQSRRRERKGRTGMSVNDGSGEHTRKSSQDPASPLRKAPLAAREVARHRQQLSESKMLRSWRLPARERGAAPGHDPMTQSQFLPQRTSGRARERRRSSPINIGRDVPILDQKLKAMAKAGIQSSSGSHSDEARQDMAHINENPSSPSGVSKPLPEVIANIFQFSEPEEVIAEYPCWYLQNVLLEGFMYVTRKHVCFYAYLQKKSNQVIKSGYLDKLPKHGIRYRRYWFQLKGDTFSYHEKASEPYFPLNQVDLRYAISAELVPPSEQEKASTDFTVTTPGRVYFYRAEDAELAEDWVKQLQKVIFRSHNDGDSVKISLPIDNILDVERNTVIESAETVKFRVIDNEETFAIDEYFFSFFSNGPEALDVLTSLIEHEDSHAGRHSGDGAVEAASSTSPPSGGSKVNQARRTFSQASRHQHDSSPSSSLIRESAESLTTASELAPSSISTGEDIDADMSASQMLIDEGVFRGPTLRSPPQPAHRLSIIPAIDRLRFDSRPPSRASGSDAERASNLAAKAPLDGSVAGERSDLERQQSAGSGRTVEQHDDRRQSVDATIPTRTLRPITAPIQHAVNLANAVRSQGKRMSSYLSSSPKYYIDRWSDAIIGGKRQYLEVEGLAPDDSVRDPEQDMDVAEHQRRFREHFRLLPSEMLVSTFFCWLHKTVPLYGKLYIGTRSLCFRSLLYGTKTKIVLPFKEIDTVHKQRGFRWGYPGMVLIIKGHEELFFDFPSHGLRDDCVVTVIQSIETKQHPIAESVILTREEQQEAEEAATENEQLQAARKEIQLPHSLDRMGVDGAPVTFDDPSTSVVDFTPKTPMRIACLTIGSRGDVQPYIALCKGLMSRGHKPVIATHKEFGPWVQQHGIEFAEVAGDPAELIRICVDNGMFTPSFFLEANSKFRSWLDGLLDTAYEACKGADLLIESPSAMCGIHIAEALEIPYFRAFTMPWTRTRAYPHAFAVPNRKLGGGYNYMTYTFFDNMFWQAIAGQINRWRGRSLGLGPTSLDKLQQNKVPFLYNFSPSVVVPPLDFSDWIKVTGYWFLDEGTHFSPPADLAAFIKKARDDKQKLVYIGFGSMTVADSRQLTQQVVDAVLKADVRCILSKGWSDRFQAPRDVALPEVPLPPCIHSIRSAPHDWLFTQVDAVVHHGGAGTTGASLRAGVPTIVKPFFGDQYFFATRVADLGVGIHLPKVTAPQLGRALWTATHDARMRAKAVALGERIRAEDGVGTAIAALYRDLEYARTLVQIRSKAMRRQTLDAAAAAAAADVSPDDGVERDIVLTEVDDAADETEEKWTFIEEANFGPSAATAAAASVAASGSGNADGAAITTAGPSRGDTRPASRSNSTWQQLRQGTGQILRRG